MKLYKRDSNGANKEIYLDSNGNRKTTDYPAKP